MTSIRLLVDKEQGEFWLDGISSVGRLTEFDSADLQTLHYEVLAQSNHLQLKRASADRSNFVHKFAKFADELWTPATSSNFVVNHTNLFQKKCEEFTLKTPSIFLPYRLSGNLKRFIQTLNPKPQVVFKQRNSSESFSWIMPPPFFAKDRTSFSSGRRLVW